jgi:hypothetical protein
MFSGYVIRCAYDAAVLGATGIDAYDNRFFFNTGVSSFLALGVEVVEVDQHDDPVLHLVPPQRKEGSKRRFVNLIPRAFY